MKMQLIVVTTKEKLIMNNVINISNFPKDKYRVKVRHYRDRKQCKRSGFNGSLWATVVRVYDAASPVVLAEGHSRCRKNDTPDRRVGLHIAMGRAAKELVHNGFSLYSV